MHSSRKREPKSLQQILRKAPTIKKLLQEADADHNRLLMIRQMLPADLASHCVSLHQQNQKLTVYLSSPAWASRMRLITPKLAEKIGVRHIICRVQSTRQQPAVKSRQHEGARHSAAAADIIESSVGQSGDADIDAILYRLSQAVRPK